jgi:hypothetical protein
MSNRFLVGAAVCLAYWLLLVLVIHYTTNVGVNIVATIVYLALLGIVAWVSAILVDKHHPTHGVVLFMLFSLPFLYYTVLFTATLLLRSIYATPKPEAFSYYLFMVAVVLFAVLWWWLKPVFTENSTASL